MRSVIKWVGLPFRLAFFAVALLGLILPAMLLIGFFSWGAASDLWREAVKPLGRWAIYYEDADRHHA